MISAYDGRMTEWPTIGRILTPTECTVTETAGGQYEAVLTHPIDPEGRWTEIKVHNILKIPVPHMPIPETILYIPATEPERTVYKYYTTTRPTHVYKYPSPNVSLGTIPAGTKCEYGYSIEDGYVRVFTPYAEMGVGYIAESDLDYTEIVTERGSPTESQISTIGAHALDDQAFRIYKTEVSSSGNSIKAYARHIFYDLAYSYTKLADFTAEASTVCSIANLIINGRDNVTGEPSGYFGGNGKAFAATNIVDVPYEEDASYENMTSLLVDPDIGLVSTARCRLVRDNYMIYLINNAETGNFTISYSKNLKSIKYSYDTDDAVTCIIPIAKGTTTFTCPGTDEYPVKYYNPYSYAAQTYPFERAYLLQVSDVENDSTGWEKMKQEAMDMFSEGCELTKLKVEVDFVNLGDTDEFRQYKNLQNVYLYDTVRIVHAPLGFADRLQVKSYEWDAILQRYNKLTLGDVFDTEIGTIPAYQFRNGSVPLSKLRADDIAAYIKKVVDTQ